MNSVNIKLCECGCGAEVQKRFVHGHNRKNISLTEEHKQALSQSNKGKTRIVSKETRLKLSKSLTGRSLSEEHKENIKKGMTGRSLSEEHKTNIAISRMTNERSDGYCPQWGDREYLEDLRKDYCEKCNLTKDESIKKYKKGLHLHHKDGDKKNCHPKNIKTLCVKCHAEEDWDRRGRVWK